jgi:hypothetical protein
MIMPTFTMPRYWIESFSYRDAMRRFYNGSMIFPLISRFAVFREQARYQIPLSIRESIPLHRAILGIVNINRRLQHKIISDKIYKDQAGEQVHDHDHKHV